MENQNNTAIFIAFGCLVMLLLSLITIMFSTTQRRKILEKENRIQILENGKKVDLIRAAVEAEEKQKVEISGNLHDEIIPLLAVISRNVDKQINNYKKGVLDIEELEMIAEAAENVSRLVRAIAHNLTPKMLTTFGFVKAIDVYINQINNAGSSAAEFQNKSSFNNEMPFSENEQLNIYRICLEILNNLSKHAAYEFLTVTLENEKDKLVINFAHNGKGINNGEVEIFRQSIKGLGLKSIQSRLLILGANINYFTEVDVAYITLKIPVRQ